jgi:hypothetical protein
MFLRVAIPLPEGQTLCRYCQPRDLVAKVGDAIANQSFLRHLLWMTEARIPRTGLSPFRFSSAWRGRGLEIIALGSQAITDLLENGHLLAKAVADHFRQNQTLEQRQLGQCAIEPSPRLVRYFIFRMIIQKYHYEARFKTEEQAHRAGAPSQFLLSHVAKLIERDLLRQGELMLIDVPDDIRVSRVALAEFKPHKLVPKRSSLSAQVAFTLNYALKGPWAVGHLTSRGFGVITHNKPVTFATHESI